MACVYGRLRRLLHALCFHGQDPPAKRIALPMWDVDRFIPFIGWTVWVYHTQFIFLLLSVGALKTRSSISRTLWSMALASALSFCIFLFYPTTLPRPLIETEGLTAQAFQFLYSIDSASNCFPSLHVALACLAALGITEERRRWGLLAIVWSGLICLSTMTTKQHYFADVIGGVCVAVVCRALGKSAFRPGKPLASTGN